MTNSLPIRSLDLKHFLEALGWLQVKEALSDSLYIFENPNFEPQQLVFGVDDHFMDHNEMLFRAIKQLSEIYELPISAMIRKIAETPDDVFCSRVASEKIDDQTLPFLFAARIVESEKKLLQAAANYVEHPQSYYSHSSYGDSQKLLDAACFRHTEAGSFIFKVSCDVYALDGTRRLQFSEREVPFVRRTMLNAARGLENLVKAIESETEQELVTEVGKGTIDSISANFCEAVVGFGDETIRNSIEFSVNWSPLLAPPNDAPQEPIRILPEYFSLIAQIGAALKPRKNALSRGYLGTVEDLKGHFNNRGQREGTVILNLFIEDNKRIKVRVSLNSEQYNDAHSIHKDNGTVVRVSGVIHPGRQPRSFDLESFEVIAPE